MKMMMMYRCICHY